MWKKNNRRSFLSRMFGLWYTNLLISTGILIISKSSTLMRDRSETRLLLILLLRDISVALHWLISTWQASNDHSHIETRRRREINNHSQYFTPVFYVMAFQSQVGHVVIRTSRKCQRLYKLYDNSIVCVVECCYIGWNLEEICHRDL